MQTSVFHYNYILFFMFSIEFRKIKLLWLRG